MTQTNDDHTLTQFVKDIFETVEESFIVSQIVPRFSCSLNQSQASSLCDTLIISFLSTSPGGTVFPKDIFNLLVATFQVHSSTTQTSHSRESSLQQAIDMVYETLVILLSKYFKLSILHPQHFASLSFSSDPTEFPFERAPFSLQNELRLIQSDDILKLVVNSLSEQFDDNELKIVFGFLADQDNLQQPSLLYRNTERDLHFLPVILRNDRLRKIAVSPIPTGRFAAVNVNKSFLGGYFDLCPFDNNFERCCRFCSNSPNNLFKIESTQAKVLDVLIRECSLMCVNEETSFQFIRWAISVCVTNADRLKIVHNRDNESSDGLLYNLCLTLFGITDKMFTSTPREQENYFILISHAFEDERLGLEKETKVYPNHSMKAMQTKSPLPLCFVMAHRLFSLIFDRLSDLYMKIVSEQNANSVPAQIFKLELTQKLFGGYINLFFINTSKYLSFLLGQDKLEIPYKSTPNELLCFIPEFVFKNITDYVKFIEKFDNERLNTADVANLFCVLSVFMSSTNICPSSYLRMTISKSLAPIFFIRGNKSGSYLIDLDQFPQVGKSVIPALMQFVCDCKETPVHTDRANLRFISSDALRIILSNGDLLDYLLPHKTWDENFAEILTSISADITDLIESALEMLSEIATINKLEKDDSWHGSLEKQEKLSNRNLLQRNVRSCFVYLKTLSGVLFNLIPFPKRASSLLHLKWVNKLTESVLKEYAETINLISTILVGSKAFSLRMRESDFGFNFHFFLTGVLYSYVSLANFPAFVNALACDRRSFDVTLLPRLVKKFTEIPESVREKTKIYQFSMVDLASTLLKLNEDAEKIYEAENGSLIEGEIPDEFLDRITFAIMRNPIILPGTDLRCDLSTIQKHLQTDSLCPFTRKKLTLDDVKPDIELKSRIDEFVAKSKKNRK